MALPLGQRLKIRSMIYVAGEPVPFFWPMRAFIHHNPLHGFEHLSFEEAALAEPLSCVLNAYEKSRIGLGDTVLIIGAGPIGIMHAKLARLGGAAKVFINDVSEARLEQCKTFDPDLITVHGEKLKEAIMSQTNNLGVDVCVTACPAPEARARGPPGQRLPQTHLRRGSPP